MSSGSFGPAADRLGGLAAVVLGWRPDEFWAATPAELSAVLGARAGEAGEPPQRAEMEALMARFPDI